MDSVAVSSDVELGGSDQLWNLLAGRDIQQRYGLRPQVAVTMPLLVGTDGVQKMSQSLGNYIAIDDEPQDMFGKVMSIPDEAMPDYFTLATDENELTKGALESLAAGTAHAGETKRLLAREIVGMYWGSGEASRAEEAFDRVHKQKLAPEEVPEHAIGVSDPVYLPILLRETGLVSSSSEARRLIRQGAVRIDGDPVDTEEVARDRLVGRVLQAGKRRFVRLTE